jgi:hypothetical protein
LTRSFAAAPVLFGVLLAAATLAQAQDRGLPRGERTDRVPARSRTALNANPTAVIAAEIALGQLAREKGEGKAMRETAAPQAVMFAPEPVAAADWLKRQDDPPVAAKWEPEAAWMSCDGSIGVVEGSWTRGEATGRFASVWQRQEKGEYQWLLHQDGGDQAKRSEAPDMLSAIVADCPARPARRNRAGDEAAPVDPLAGQSDDATLSWKSGNDASGRRCLLVRIAKDGVMKTVLGEELEAQK